jgi:hypothetical protein
MQPLNIGDIVRLKFLPNNLYCIEGFDGTFFIIRNIKTGEIFNAFISEISIDISENRNKKINGIIHR